MESNSYGNFCKTRYSIHGKIRKTSIKFLVGIVIFTKRYLLNVHFLNFQVRKKRMAMLDILITASMEEGSIDDAGIREEVDTFVFEVIINKVRRGSIKYKSL